MTDHAVEVPTQVDRTTMETATEATSVPAVQVTEAPETSTHVPTQSLSADQPVDVVCPGCGSPSQVDPARRDAEDFCRTCDYPLFWAVERRPASAGDGLTDTGLRRLPGTAGRASLAALRCPSCTEPNQPSAVHCARCGAELRPARVVAPEPEPVVEAPVVVETTPWWRNWWVLGLGVSVLLALIALAVLLLAY